MITRGMLKRKHMTAVPTSQNEVHQFKLDAIKELKIVGIKAEEKVKVVPGFSQCSGHRAVFFKHGQNNVFKLELGITQSDNFITKTFACPKVSCNVQDKTFTELANHHLICHRIEGETIKQVCCGEEFPFFELFCEHVYIYHRNTSSTIRPYFYNIRQTKLDEYLKKHKVCFLYSFEMEVTFNDLLDLGGQIILSFDRYWIFMWNCQDFVVWYLYSLGIPLQVLDPTLSDKLTGSSTDSNVRKVQGFKGWLWYKQPEQLKRFGSIVEQARYTCNKCEFLPLLTIEALNQHEQFAHKDQNTHHSDPCQVNEKEVCHYLSGGGQGLSLSSEPTRRWDVYRLRGKSATAHASVVFRPWILDQKKDAKSIRPSEIFVSVEKRLNYREMPYLFVRDLDEKYQRKLERCCTIAVSIQELVDYISLVFGCMIAKGLTQTCVEYVFYLLKMLFGDKNADRTAFVVESAYTRHRGQMRQYLYQRIEKIITHEKFAVDVHSTVGSDTLTQRGRIAQVATRLHGKYLAMLPLLVMFMMTLLYFSTIGKIIFLLMIVFTVYFMYSVVFSHYRIIGKRWLLLKISKSWNSETRLILVQDLIHVLSMVLLVGEVCLDLDKLQSMILIQMIWLNFLFMSREVENRCTVTQRRFQGSFKPSVFKLLQFNLSRDCLRVSVIMTFLLPAYIIRLFILLEMLTIILCSRVFPRTFPLKHFTGNESPEFHVFLFVFLIIMSGLLFYTGDIMIPHTNVSQIHILFFVTYLSISLWINSNEALKQMHYVQEISSPSQRFLMTDTKETMQHLRICLMIFSRICFIVFVLPILGKLALLFSSAFQAMLVFLSLSLYAHCASVCIAIDIKDILMTLVEDALKKDNPVLQHASLL
ncbi:hypothetical protein FSP39_006022 [Pinctada imbricata]|uniref:Uncharacterized protein n=1 Tax=Pinctada imbricata TaxID=66713 RepID=A0AA89BSC8_PINIB|nr:hypothetical protein FSP39_006022 [Pinctada imbricata]